MRLFLPASSHCGWVLLCSITLACSSSGAGDTPGGSAGSSGAPGGGAIAAGGSTGGGNGGTLATGGAGGSATSGGSSAAGTAGSSSGSGGEGGALGPGDKPFDWVGIIGSGQSLSVGWESTAISTTQPFANIALEDSGPDPKYPIDGSVSAVWGTVPLIEPMRAAVAGTGEGYDDWQYPNNIGHSGDTYGETPHSGMANTLSTLWQTRGGEGDYITAHSIVGWSGHPIGDIDKTGGKRAYVASLSEAAVFKTLADAAGVTYGVAGIILTHGESDAGNPTYGDSVWQLYQDYNADIKTTTSQTRDVVLLVSQQSSSAGYGNSAVQIWKDGVDHPGQIVCTGPKYQYRPYGLHLPGPGYERVGEKYAEVFDLIVNQGIDWKPLGPNNISRSGAVITLDFDVPNPPLVWDTHLIAPHQAAHTAWANGHGFEVIDDAKNEIAIESVEIDGNSVVITLSADPGSKVLTVGYALTQDSPDAYQGGADLGPHGQLRDSDPFVGYDLETVDVNVTNGSAVISEVTQGGLGHRTGWDIVTGDNIADDTVIAATNYSQMTLSAPWSGATGTASLTFHHNHYNFGVHFDMPVP